MALLVATRFTPTWRDRSAAIAAYERHVDEVRRTAPTDRLVTDRLVEWHPGDGWEPLCRALGEPVPDEPFPHLNTTDDCRGRAGLDAAPGEAAGG